MVGASVTGAPHACVCGMPPTMVPTKTSVGPNGIAAGLINAHAAGRLACGAVNVPTTVTAPARFTVTQIFFESSSIRAARRVAFTSAVFAGSALNDRLAGGVLVSTGVPAFGAVTLNSITWPVPAGFAILAGTNVSLYGTSGPVLIMRTLVPGGKPVKSTITSARSAGAISSALLHPGSAGLLPGNAGVVAVAAVAGLQTAA